jgi:hypothetical protein
MDRRFYEAWFNTEHTVLGRKLHPFCLEDALILSLAESPFLVGTVKGVDYALPDLQLAVKVCSTPGEVFLHARFNRSWLKKLMTSLWVLRCRQMNLKEQCQRFVTYIDDYNSPPDLWHDSADAGDGQLRAPWVLANATFLIRHTTFNPREVWTMPLGQALWYAATLSEQLGAKVQLVSEEEQAGIDAIEQLQREEPEDGQ